MARLPFTSPGIPTEGSSERTGRSSWQRSSGIQMWLMWLSLPRTVPSLQLTSVRYQETDSVHGKTAVLSAVSSRRPVDADRLRAACHGQTNKGTTRGGTTPGAPPPGHPP
jgi:hypothetical protein